LEIATNKSYHHLKNPDKFKKGAVKNKEEMELEIFFTKEIFQI
jgi:hypothetical protein